MKVLFGEAFLKSLRKHSSIEKEIQKKVDLIIASPLLYGEPLKGNLRGFYSTPVKKNFLIIYLYCLPCRKKGDYKIVLCSDCDSCQDDTIKFIALGPHDTAYK
jgi:mRNA-degrading endonuclease YafQ of YafQ-DinJ toxin-antitoxin module